MLAAGVSSRMGGRWKMLLPLQGSTVIERSVTAALAACRRVILVTGHRAEELERLFEDRRRVIPVPNPSYESGMFSSIKRGAEAVSTRRCFISLGDMPLIGPGVYRELLRHRAACVLPKHGGRLGHPVLLDRAVLRRIGAWSASGSLRDVLEAVPTLSVPVSDPHVLSDLDTPEDYEGIREGGTE